MLKPTEHKLVTTKLLAEATVQYCVVLYCTHVRDFFLNFWTNRVKALFNTAINAVALAGAES